MENVKAFEWINTSIIDTPEISVVEKNTSLDTEDLHETTLPLYSPENFYKPSVEDAGIFLNNLFRGKDTILTEDWETNSNVQGKILSIHGNDVFVDCLMDLGKNIIQKRCFPINLFSHLNKVVGELPVIIQTKTKPGSVRIDVYPGEGIVDLKLFQSIENWESLKGKNLDTKLTEW